MGSKEKTVELAFVCLDLTPPFGHPSPTGEGPALMAEEK